ncbi:MAG: cupin domain-containing protein [Ferruginibacter sp.]
MSNQIFKNFSDITAKEIAPGFMSTFIHTDNNTINFIDVKAGSNIPLHQHVHQQYSFVLEGKFEMTADGETQVLHPGKFALIPSEVLHGGTAVTDCKILDIFNPVREDYKKLSEG